MKTKLMGLLMALVFVFFSGSQIALAQTNSIYDYDFQMSSLDFAKSSYASQEAPFKATDDWVIDDFTTIYHLEKDSTIKVDERIWVNFFLDSHGIYRYIPTVYKNDQGLYYNLRLKLDSVTNQTGDALNIADKQRSDPFYLKIGDPNVTFTGQQLYRIKYQTQRGIRYFDDHDELYWNVTGWDWAAPILNAKAVVILPQAINQSDVKLKCYLGEVGSQETACEYRFLDNQTIEFKNTRVFNEEIYPKEDFTIVVWLPKGVVTEPSTLKKIGWTAADNWGLLILPFLTLVILYLIWRKWGRDEKNTKAIIAQYEENKDISPLLASILLKSSQMRDSDLSAEIIYLATRKFIKIEEKATKNGKVNDYRLVKIKEADDTLKTYQKFLMDKFFAKDKTILISSLTNKFYNHLAELRRLTSAYSSKFFNLRPMIFSVFIAIGLPIGFIIAFAGFSMMRSDIGLGGIISGVLIIVFGRYMPKRNALGNDTLWYIQGLKLFIETAEKYRAKFYEDENIFDRILPYAMAFGMVDKWVTAFKDIYKGQPDWYQSTTPFNFMLFNSALTSFSSKSNSTLRSMPASRGGSSGSSGFSSGGGFSGGGFGGGGGGRW